MSIQVVDFPHEIEPNPVESKTGSIRLPNAAFTASSNTNSFFKAEFIIIAVLLVAALMLMKIAE